MAIFGTKIDPLVIVALVSLAKTPGGYVAKETNVDMRRNVDLQFSFRSQINRISLPVSLKSSTCISPTGCNGKACGSCNNCAFCGTFGIKKHAGTETSNMSRTCPPNTSHSKLTQLQLDVAFLIMGENRVQRRSIVDIPANSVMSAPAMTEIIFPKFEIPSES